MTEDQHEDANSASPQAGSGIESPKTPRPPEADRQNFSAREIFGNARYFQYEKLMTRIIGFSGLNITPEREEDINNLLWLLKSCGFLPEEPAHAPFTALVTMIWARLPIVAETVSAASAGLGGFDGKAGKAVSEEISRQVVEKINSVSQDQNRTLFEFSKQFNQIAETELKPQLETQTEWLKKILARVNAPQADGGSIDGKALAGQLSDEIQKKFSGVYLALVVMAGFLGLLAGIFIGPGLLKIAHFL